MTDNLFDNAKFGDIFFTTENKKAVFLRFAENAEYKFAILYVEGWGSVQVFKHNGKEIYNDVAHSIISKQEEPKSIWHDANQQPTMYRKYLVRYSDGRVSGSWERHDDGFIPWKDVVKEHGFTHWCYTEDLLKL